MTERSTHHSTIVIERTYDAAPSRVFAAWSNREALLRWGNPGDGWEIAYDQFVFRVGGTDINRFGPKGGPAYVNETTYYDIVQDARIVSGGNMTTEGRRIFAGLMTVEFLPAGKGCRLIMTEQGVFLDGHDKQANHEVGWAEMLDKLGIELKRNETAA
ncbi:SRPBCC family protein [Rhizobium sp. PL01]|jgi:uncharacterized protein YndB with AHSA1/START domain|uniref:SRPBCC family protein n=1 Tax=Rhizobium sp. PL01 TaxID=3085631 RepID=UPI00298231D0|nr:SRPBCC family protein [Rhizobium sp. PL01]MDW5317841.1 SRPBCC family protein [Rhizobium sp. PL01]